jgi:TRAP-type C4-dicarboxylate transport system permease small subunit
MDEQAQKKLNVAINVAMAILLLVAMIYLGVFGGNYLKKKMGSEAGATAKGDNARANAAWGTATVIFVIMAVIYLLSKIAKKNST